MADSQEKTSDTTFKVHQSRSEEVWEIVIELFTDNGAHAEGTFALPFNGIIRNILVTLPATTATGTTSTVTIDDNSNFEVFNSGALAENASHGFPIDLPLSGTIDISLDMNADPTGSGVTNVVTLRGI